MPHTSPASHPVSLQGAAQNPTSCKASNDDGTPCWKTCCPTSRFSSRSALGSIYSQSGADLSRFQSRRDPIQRQQVATEIRNGVLLVGKHHTPRMVYDETPLR